MRQLVTRLREATRPQHERLEASVAILRPSADEHSYRRHLERLYGLLLPLERAIAAVPGLGELGLDFERRRKSGALAHDLEALGAGAQALSRLPRCGFLPELADVPAALGCLYVVEGSSLGGQVLYRELAPRMPRAMRVASRYLRFYGAETGERWRTFLDALAPYEDQRHDSAALVQAAQSTFAVFHSWLADARAGTGVAQPARGAQHG